MVNSTFISDTELTSYINYSVAELYDLLVGAYGSDYYVTSTTFSVTSGTDAYALPTDFYKLRGVDIQINGGEYLTLQPFNFNERNTQNGVGWNFLLDPTFRYQIVGSNLKFTPIPVGTYTVKLWYIPTATKLVADGDTFADLNQWSEYVIVDAAIKMLQKEESDVSVLMAQKADLRKRIENMAQNRDAANPSSVSDIYAETSDWWTFRD